MNNQTSSFSGSKSRHDYWARNAKRSVPVEADYEAKKKTTPAPPPPIPSMNLVAISLSNGNILSSALACQEFPDCPWYVRLCTWCYMLEYSCYS